MACPGSVQLGRGIPNTSSIFAQEGTAAHALGELALRKNVDPDMWLGMELEGVEVTEDMVDFVRIYVEHCRSLMQIPGATYFIEKRFDLGKLNPPGPMFGTNDFGAADPAARQLHIVDLKYGRGVVVEVKGNKQLRYYALGFVMTLPKELLEQIDEIVLTIVQPRCSHPDGVIRSETISLMDLLDFTGELLSAARRTLDPDAPLKAGEHCRFCPASPICPEQRRQAEIVAQVEFAAMPADVPPAPASLPDQIFVDILSKLPILEQWMKDMRAHALAKLEHGEQVPGFKLVQKRATRKFGDEENVAQVLKARGFVDEEIFKQDLKSPAQIEKLFGSGKKGKQAFEAELGAAVARVSSGYSMVPDNDPRPAYTPTPGEDFAALPSGEE